MIIFTDYVLSNQSLQIFAYSGNIINISNPTEAAHTEE
jgi:hypothetical protein